MPIYGDAHQWQRDDAPHIIQAESDWLLILSRVG